MPAEEYTFRASICLLPNDRLTFPADFIRDPGFQFFQTFYDIDNVVPLVEVMKEVQNVEAKFPILSSCLSWRQIYPPSTARDVYVDHLLRTFQERRVGAFWQVQRHNTCLPQRFDGLGLQHTRTNHFPAWKLPQLEDYAPSIASHSCFF